MGKQIHARAREARVKLEPSAVEIANGKLFLSLCRHFHT